MNYSSQMEPAHSGRRKCLVRLFESLEVFREEFRKNISNGGIFIASEDDFEMRELVDVILELAWSSERVPLEGEVVRLVKAESRDSGGAPGVAVQFVATPAGVHDRLIEIADLALTTEHPREASDPVRRPAPAREATRKLEDSSVRSPACSCGREVGDSSEEGTESTGTPATASSVPSAKHMRNPDAITGPIATLGMANLVQMFSSCADRGLLTLDNGNQHGTVGFASGSLVHARLGRASGVKALARLFSWNDGEFEFIDDIDDACTQVAAVPIYGAVMEAMTQLDELSRLDLRDWGSHERVELDLESMFDTSDDLEKLQNTILSSVAEGWNRIGDLLDRLADFDAEIYSALDGLRERGRLRINTL